MDFDHLPADPLAELKQWVEEAQGLPLFNPHAMTLATVDGDGRPSARTVLLKGLDERGAVFYTNTLSRKGEALEANPRAAMVFYWDGLLRQLTIEGRVSSIDATESDAYFASRPRGSQVGAWASLQSQPLESRRVLEERAAEVSRSHEQRPIPRPPHWGGYRVSLDRIEFWQGRPDRLHDRVVYVQTEGGWEIRRLYP